MRRFAFLMLAILVIAGCERAPKGRATPDEVLNRPKTQQSGPNSKIEMH